MHLRFVVPCVLVGLVGAAAIVALTVPADAARRKGRICQTDHFHYGSSAGQRSKKVARAKTRWLLGDREQLLPTAFANCRCLTLRHGSVSFPRSSVGSRTGAPA